MHVCLSTVTGHSPSTNAILAAHTCPHILDPKGYMQSQGSCTNPFTIVTTNKHVSQHKPVVIPTDKHCNTVWNVCTNRFHVSLTLFFIFSERKGRNRAMIMLKNHGWWSTYASLKRAGKAFCAEMGDIRTQTYMRIHDIVEAHCYAATTGEYILMSTYIAESINQ